MAVVTLENLGVVFPDGFAALTDVTLTVGDGEFVALIGPSGSGKTTLLRAVAGFLTPTSGRVLLDDVEVGGPRASVPPERRALGMVFQQHAVWPHMTVGANVAYPLRLAGMPRTRLRERVAEVLRLVGLEGFEERSPATLSGGQRQRVALARALAPNPTVLLLDEALSALDEPLRDELRIELRSLTRTMGLTVLHVTHDRGEALALADRIAVLDAGRIAQVGTPADLLSDPATPFVARFLSDATIVPGALTNGTFRAESHPLAVGGDTLRTRGGTPGDAEGSLVMVPHGVEALRDGDDAVVVSSLFGRSSSDVVVDWDGLRLRLEASWRPEVGDRVGIRVRHATFHPGPSDD